MGYKVIITKFAKHQLDMYVGYTADILKNRQAAKAIISDARDTNEMLSIVADKLALCDNAILRQHGYRRILFKKHDFFMVYRLDGNKAIYHELQDYESTFITDMHLSEP